MIRQLLHSLLLVLAGGAAAMALLAAAEPPQQLPLIKADFPLCVHVNPNGELAKPRGRRVNGRIITSEIS